MRTQTEQNERTLEEVAPGERGVILQVGNENGPVKRRLVDMGLTPGTEVTVRKVAPFGDPVELNLRGCSTFRTRKPSAGWMPTTPMRRRSTAACPTTPATTHGR